VHSSHVRAQRVLFRGHKCAFVTHVVLSAVGPRLVVPEVIVCLANKVAFVTGISQPLVINLNVIA